MARTALLLGAETYDLQGVHHDVTAMSRLLLGRGFTVITRRGADATRAGILDAYESLISSADPGDAVVVYFTGHGGQAPEGRFIVPTDFAQTTEHDFRGITDLELSVLQARLTARTRNVVTILDCCHAARMCREPTARTKAIPEVRQDLAAHHRRLIRAGLRADLTGPAGNPDAVRLVACAAGAQAHEDRIAGRWSGVFTAALTATLAEAAGLPVSWSTLVARVRARLAAEDRPQRPEAEGPARRLLFELREADPAGSLPAVADDSGVRLDGAPFFGHRVGDRFVVMPPGFTRPDRERMTGEVTVDRLLPTAAIGRLRPAGPVPLGARAFCTRAGAPALAVRVPAGIPYALESVYVRPGRPEELCPLEVRAGARGEFTVHDRIGPLHTHRGWDGVVAELSRLGRAAALRALEDDRTGPIELTWGRMAGGAALPEPAAGASVVAGHPIYLTVRNRGTGTAWVSLIDIGVTAAATVLTRFAPSGVALPPGESWTFDADPGGRPTGLAPYWPPSLAVPLPRPETVLALSTPEPLDVSFLEQPATRDGVHRLRPFAVRKITFTLVPGPR